MGKVLIWFVIIISTVVLYCLIQYVHRVYCKNTYLDMTDFLIETLTGYNEIQIF